MIVHIFVAKHTRSIFEQNQAVLLRIINSSRLVNQQRCFLMQNKQIDCKRFDD